MKLQVPSWRALPRVKASRPQWRYALRNGIAMCLALSIAYWLDLDEPYWAMTSAAVVSFPTVGGVISKSFGRIAGSLLGACAALLLAGHTLNDPAIFIQHFGVDCALYLGLRNVYQQRGLRFPARRLHLRHYRLSGYQHYRRQRAVDYRAVASLRGYRRHPVRRADDDDHAQYVGWHCAADGIENMHARLLEHASLLWVPETTDAIRTAHESVIGQILTMNLLRIQAFWSHYRFRRQNPLLNYLLHQQLRLTSVISSLRRMLVNWPAAPAQTREVLETLLIALANPRADFTLSHG